MVRISTGSAVFLLLVGVGMIVVGVHLGRKEYAIMKTWPRTDAVVVSSGVREGRGKHGSTLYSPRLQLKYSVAGKEYVRDAEMSGWATSSRSSSQKVVDDYRPGTYCTVPYNPADPNEVHMQLGGSFHTFSGPLVALLTGFAFVLPGLLRLFKLAVHAG